MNMPKLLIADVSDEYRQILFDNLSQNYIIKTCRDGIQALELLRSFRPDLLVIDLMLPGLDGISLMQRSRGEGICPATLVFCPYPSDYVTSALHRLEVSYLMSKPCDLQAVADRLADLAAGLQPEPVQQANISSAISGVLLSLGLQARWSGFQFLQFGTPMYMRDPSIAITKELYTAIGDEYNKNAQQVERCIRSAIETAWRSRDEQIWRQYFYTVGGTVPKPSNSEFVARIANALADQGYHMKRAQ